jgi:hypothetical protein
VVLMSYAEGAIQRLRFMRVSGESSKELKRVARLYQRNLGLDANKLLAEAAKPGSVDNPLVGLGGKNADREQGATAVGLLGLRTRQGEDQEGG